MQSGDGLIVRVRPPLGALGANALTALAEAAARFGNGHLDLTRRANVQLRGVREASLPSLYDVIEQLGFLDENPDGEAVRNVVINPLAGIDPQEALDLRNIAQQLARVLATEPSLWELSSKFGFIIDGAGILGLSEQRADIRLTAVKDGPDAIIALGLDTAGGIDWLGQVSPESAAAMAIEAARAFLEAAPQGKQQGKRPRMRDLSPDSFICVRDKIKSRLQPLQAQPSASDAKAHPRIGLLTLDSDRLALGIAAPFGRAEADQLLKLARVMVARGIDEIRLSPWRTLYAAMRNRHTAEGFLDEAKAIGFVTDPFDNLLQIEACPGAPACRSTALDTRGDARRLAEYLSQSHFTGTVHVSGCAKGCAKSEMSDLVLVGDGGSYGIVHHGTAQDTPGHRMTSAELASGPGDLLAIGNDAA
jgi:precorrin-3B synthase